MTTGEMIRTLRLEKGWTQEELAKRLGVQKAAVYKYEKGLVVNLKREVLERLACALDTTPARLLGEAAEPDILDEVDVAFYGDYKDLTEAQKETLRDMARILKKANE